MNNPDPYTFTSDQVAWKNRYEVCGDCGAEQRILVRNGEVFQCLETPHHCGKQWDRPPGMTG